MRFLLLIPALTALVSCENGGVLPEREHYYGNFHTPRVEQSEALDRATGVDGTTR